MENTQSENPKFPTEKEELISMYEEDLGFMLARKNSWEKVEESRKNNVKKLKEIILKIGWPTISKVGEEACFSAFMITQHADFDLDFQKQSLKMMEQARDDIHLFELAALTDRVAVNSGEEQPYGTQWEKNEKGELVPRTPIKDFENVKQRRGEMGLMPLEIYKKRMELGGEYLFETESYVKRIGRFQAGF